jgi:hypothetical protein
MEEIISRIEQVWQERDFLKVKLLEMQENYAKVNEELRMCKAENDRHRTLWYESKDEVEKMKKMISGYNMQITSMEREIVILRDKCQLLNDTKQHSLYIDSYIRNHNIVDEIKSRDKEIARLKNEINNKSIVEKKSSISTDKNKIEEDSQRELIENLIAYAEKLPKHRCLEATAIQGAISLLVTRRKISNNVINDELGKRLENITKLRVILPDRQLLLALCKVWLVAVLNELRDAAIHGIIVEQILTGIALQAVWQIRTIGNLIWTV